MNRSKALVTAGIMDYLFSSWAVAVLESVNGGIYLSAQTTGEGNGLS